MASRLALALLLGLVIAAFPGEAQETLPGNSGQLLGTTSDEPLPVSLEGHIELSKRTWTLPEARKCRNQYCCMRRCAGDYYPFIIGVYHVKGGGRGNHRGCWCYRLPF
ncbi:Hypp2018 [Branchiostoma lanceolatum]|uniref:Hypp2018 protein n=2 Tax=Branchiostoma lanceolatum TaxID=7740 RepID=A0A8J9ZQE7_BRALA|nr:Hypp2018 [Branchiostoma lanceolatum]